MAILFSVIKIVLCRPLYTSAIQLWADVFALLCPCFLPVKKLTEISGKILNYFDIVTCDLIQLRLGLTPAEARGFFPTM